MTIQSTIHGLYAIMCEAQAVASGEGSKQRLLSLIARVPDKDVVEAIDNVAYILQELANVDANFRKMYMLHYVTGTDEGNKNVLLQMECVWGTQTIKFTTQMDDKATQGLIDALSMSQAMVRAGHRLSEEGRA